MHDHPLAEEAVFKEEEHHARAHLEHKQGVNGSGAQQMNAEATWRLWAVVLGYSYM